MGPDVAKINAAAAALSFVESGMTVGLGTGTTASHFVRLLAQSARQGLDVRGVPTSEATRKLAESHGLKVVTPDEAAEIHVCVDGADEIDPMFRLIKGGGGALLREKIIACAAAHFIVIADETKLVQRLGRFALPVEVTPFGFSLTARKIYGALRATGCQGRVARLRETAKGDPVVTDGGNYILDCACEAIAEPEALADALVRIPGVVEHGLFIDLARTVIIGQQHGADVRER